MPRTTPETFTCAQLWQRMMVWSDGKVLPCCSDIFGHLALGNAWTDSLYALWHGEAFTRYREIHAQGDYKELTACRSCSIPRMAASERIAPPEF